MPLDTRHDKLVLEAVRYRRYVGADAAAIRSYVKFREEQPHGKVEDQESLARLEAEGCVRRVDRLWFLSATLEKETRGPAYPPSWQPEDSWILLALLRNAQSSGASTLEDLIAMADAINKGIPTLNELYGALNRLASARLIRYRQGRFSVTDRATELFVKADAACGRELFKQWDCLRRLLECPCCGVALKAVRWRIPVTEEELDAVYERYGRRWAPVSTAGKRSSR